MPNILNPKFKYTPSHATDIRETFKKHKMKPVSRRKQQQIKSRLNPI